MHKYNQEGLREEIREALLVIPRTRGQLDGFENNGYSETKYSHAPYRHVTNDNGDIIGKVKAEVITTLACRQFKRSPMPLCPQAFRHSKLVHDMNSSSEHIGDWLRFCYSEGAALPTKALLEALLDVFYQGESGRVNASSKELIKHLALLACMQKRMAINTEKALLTQTKVAELAGKSQKSWEKTWAKRWSRFHVVLERFDTEGLNHVYESQRRRKTTRRDGNMPVQSVLRISAREAVASCVVL